MIHTRENHLQCRQLVSKETTVTEKNPYTNGLIEVVLHPGDCKSLLKSAVRFGSDLPGWEENACYTCLFVENPNSDIPCSEDEPDNPIIQSN